MASRWSPELDLKVRELWSDHSASQIAGVLAVEGIPITRNSIIGRMHRLGLTVDSKTEVHPSTNHNAGTRPKPERKPANEGSVGSLAFKVIYGIKAPQQGLRAPDVPLPESFGATDDSGCLKIPFSALEAGDRKCRWPFDVPQEVVGSFVYCGLHTPDCAPYCIRHARIAYQAPQPRRNAA